MTTIKLTPTQRQVLKHAIDRTDGRIDWFPENVKGGARKKVLDGLFNRALITTDGADWFVAAEGYDALGRKRPAPRPATVPPEIGAPATAVKAKRAKDKSTSDATPRTRENSKQAEVIRMLKRPEGATILQICGATGWQKHTVRGTFSGAFKKKLGLAIVSEKPAQGERVYRIT